MGVGLDCLGESPRGGAGGGDGEGGVHVCVYVYVCVRGGWWRGRRREVR